MPLMLERPQAESRWRAHDGELRPIRSLSRFISVFLTILFQCEQNRLAGSTDLPKLWV
jgi:hypothetical protein